VQVYICPSGKGKAENVRLVPDGRTNPTYGINLNLFNIYHGNAPIKLSSIDLPAETVFFADDQKRGSADPTIISNNWIDLGNYCVSSSFSERHLETGNVLFVDGHVKAMKAAELLKSVPNTTSRAVMNGDSASLYTPSTTSQIFWYWQTANDGAYF
jgi:prepilin-type processing-associated H-X9-DG protein